MRLEDVSGDKTAAALAGQVDEIAAYFGLDGDKVVAQSYDGAIVMSGDKAGVQALVKQRFPKAGYIHCRAHVLNLVLLHSCMKNKNCSKFFNTISSLAAFFSQSPKRSDKLKEFMETKIPNVCKTKWSYSSRMIKIVDLNYESINDCLGEIYLGDSDFDAETCTNARGLHAFMLEFNTVFLLKLFAQVFAHTDVLYQILQAKELDVVECVRSVKCCIASIEELKADVHFDNVLKDSIKVSAETINEAKQVNYRRLYDSIIDKIIDEMIKRFKELSDYKFIGLLNHEKFASYAVAAPIESLKMLTKYHAKFDEAKLGSELIVVHSREEFRNKTVKDIISIILEQKLEQTFSETLRLAKLILTLPNTTASVERTFSVLRRLKNYLRTTMGEKRLFGLMLMAVEGDLLNEMMKRPLFYDEVIDAFASKINRRIPLMYK